MKENSLIIDDKKILNSQQKIHIYANGPLENEETVLKAEKELFDDFTPPKPPIVIDS